MITTPALVIRRLYTASPERVYEAWTNPAIAVKFFCPGDVVAANVRMDVRLGGTYSIDMRRTGGDVWTVTGTFRDVQPGRRLEMTWRWTEDNPSDEIETLLTVEFHPADGGTELVLTHAQFRSDQSRSNHENGWSMILEKLVQAL